MATNIGSVAQCYQSPWFSCLFLWTQVAATAPCITPVIKFGQRGKVEASCFYTFY